MLRTKRGPEGNGWRRELILRCRALYMLGIFVYVCVHLCLCICVYEYMNICICGGVYSLSYMHVEVED